jgi:hypothetical protein
VVEVVDTEDFPIEGVDLVLHAPKGVAGAMRMDRTLVDGVVRFDDLEAGTWTLMAEAPDLEHVSVRVAIVAGQVRRVRLVMDLLMPPPEPPEDEDDDGAPDTPSPWLRGSSMVIPFLSPEEAYDALVDLWIQARVGIPRVALSLPNCPGSGPQARASAP